MRRLIILAVAVLVGPACKRTSPHAAPSAAPVASDPAPAVASPELRTLAGRLAYEAAHRPAGAIRLEDLVAAAAKAGVEIVDTKQYLGLTASAAYCAGGQTRDGLAVSVCEYGDPAAAAAGRDHITRQYATVGPARQIVVRGATTLITATEQPTLAPTRAAVEQAFATL